MLEVVARGGCLRGEPVQTINSLVTQGLITPQYCGTVGDKQEGEKNPHPNHQEEP